MASKSIKKIIKVGETSLAVIIPIAWLRYNDLGYGDKIEVITDDFVTIKPLQTKEETT